MEKVDIGIKEIMDTIPHRYPFLLVDKIIELEEGVGAKGIKNVTMNEPFFQGHFPAEPVMPGVLIIEALAQVGAYTVVSMEENKLPLSLPTGPVLRSRFAFTIFKLEAARRARHLAMRALVPFPLPPPYKQKVTSAARPNTCLLYSHFNFLR